MTELFNHVAPLKLRVFFGEKGLTQTEANHKANIIKEKAEAIGAKFINTAAYRAVVDFDGKQVSIDTFERIDLKAEATLEGDMYALSAWLREAVKAKNDLITFIRTKVTPEMLDLNKEIPAAFTNPLPIRPDNPRFVVPTADDIIGTWTTAERAEYLGVEAKASHLGKKIHKSGIISKLRGDLHAKRSTAFKDLPAGAGMKAYVMEFKPLYDIADVDKIFFDLQEEHRSLESRLNWYRAKLQNELTAAETKARKEYADAVNKLNAEYGPLYKDWSDANAVYLQELYAWQNLMEGERAKLINYVSQLKIIVPHAYEHVLEEIKK